MLNIALSNESFSPQYDGVAVCVENYAKIINQSYGNSYVIVPSNDERQIDSFDYPIYQYPTTRISLADQYKVGIPISPKLSKKINDIPFDLIHSHCPFVSGILSQRIAAKKNIPHISTFHSKFKDDVNQRLKYNFELPGELVAKYVVSFYNRCDYVWTVSNGTANTLREYGYEGNINVIPNGCDMPITHFNKNDRLQIASEYGLDPNSPILLFVGRLTYVKNIKPIIKALGALARHDKKFNMLFVGNGEDMDNMRKEVKDENLEDHVKFAGKILSREKLRKIYSSSDLFIFPSIYDNAPLVVREAAACGCASLLIKDSNSSEGITDGYNGFLAKDTVEDITLSIDRALSRKDLNTIGDKARDTIYITWDTVLDRVTTEYEKIILDWDPSKSKMRKYFDSISMSKIDLLKDFNINMTEKIKNQINKQIKK